MENINTSDWTELKRILTTLPEANEKQLKQFAWVMSAAFLIIGLWPLVFRHQSLRVWCFPFIAIFLVASFLAPKTLTKPYQGWMVLGGILGHINAKIILTIVYFGMVTPIAILLRCLGKDIIGLRFDPKTESYRTPATKSTSPEKSRLTHQF